MMRETNWRGEFFEGLRESIPINIAITPVGALFGAVAVASGLSPFEAVLSSALMFTGAGQFVMLEVNGLNVPLWLIVLSVFAVAFRHILYSAALARKIRHFPFWQKFSSLFFLTDPSFASIEARSDDRKIMPTYVFGYGVTLYLVWLLSTLLGTIFGSLIEKPETFGLDVIVPLYFLILLMGFRKRGNWLPVVCVSGIVSVLLFKFVGSPWHISFGALAGILTAALLPIEKVESDV